MSPFATYKKLNLLYDVQDTFQAGIELSGHEVKAVRLGRVTMEGSFVTTKKGPHGLEAYIINMSIHPYQERNTPKDYEIDRPRKLILTKKEIRQLGDEAERHGLTVVPISLYNKGRVIKVDIAIVKGKKLHDKRATLKRKAVDKDIERELASRRQ